MSKTEKCIPILVLYFSSLVQFLSLKGTGYALTSKGWYFPFLLRKFIVLPRFKILTRTLFSGIILVRQKKKNK